MEIRSVCTAITLAPFVGVETTLHVASSGFAINVDQGAVNNGVGLHAVSAVGGASEVFRIEDTGSGTFRIRHVPSGRVLDADASRANQNGCGVQLWDDLNGLNQRWRLQTLDDGRLQITNAASGLALDVSTQDGHLQLWSSHGGANQRWLPGVGIASPDSIRVGNTGLALDVPANNLGNGASLVLAPSTGTNLQVWRVEEFSDGTARIRHVQTGKVLDADTSTLNRNGGRVQLYDNNDTANQHWRLLPSSNGQFRIANVASGKVLDVATQDGHLQLWDDLGGTNQSWLLGSATRVPAENPGGGGGGGGNDSPEIEVLGVRDGQSQVISFGTVTVGSAAPTQTFTVRNDGTATLQLFDTVNVPAGFQVSGASPMSLAPGRTTQFTISLSTNQVGTFGGEFSFSNNDSDEGPFNFRLSGTIQSVTGAGPEITVLVNGSSIQDGQSSAISFGQQQQGTAQRVVSFIIRNDGRQTLQLGTPTVPSGFTIVQAPQRSLGAGRQTTMVVAMRTNQPGTFRGEIVLTNNDSDENPFNIRVEGRVIAPPRTPEIAVIVSGRELAVGETGNLNFGATFTNLVPARREFQIRNTGDDVLVLSNVQVTGNFSTSSPRELRLLPGESRTISVTLGNTLGTQRGSLTFRSNDSDEGAVSITLLGRTLSPPVTVSGNPIRVDISGTFTLTLDSNIVKVEIDPPHERVPFGTSYVVTVTSRNGSQSRFNLDGNLHTLRVLGSGSRTASIENWTSVTVRTT